MNSAASAKGDTPANMWPWYGVYQNGYQGQPFNPFGHQGYFPFYSGNGMQFGGPQQHQHQQQHHQQQQQHHQQQQQHQQHQQQQQQHQQQQQQQRNPQITLPPTGLKEFVHGGSLMPFNQSHQQQQQQNSVMNSNNQNKMKERAEKEQNDGPNEGDMPPLPPGPPPPSVMRYPQPPNSPSPTRFPYQPNCMNPVKFSFGQKQQPQQQQQQHPPRQGLGFQGGQGEGSKKKRKRKGGQGKNVPQFTPPEPPHVLLNVPPPLPPGPPPPSPAPPPPSSPPPCQQKSPAALSASPFSNNIQRSLQSNKMCVTNDWPQSLKNYTNRCYEKCATSMDRDRVEIILKGKIMRASADETLWTKDWDNEPLPLSKMELDNITLKPNSGKQKNTISSSLENRLGIRKSLPHKSRSPLRKISDSPPKRRRDRSWSSSSSSEEMKPVKSSKGKQAKNFKNKNKSKQNKMKSHFYSEMGCGNEAVNPELLEKRAARFSSGNTKSESPLPDYQSPLIACRTGSSKKMRPSLDMSNAEFDLGDFHVVGVCQDLEKPYLRLTAAPEASAVRPPDVLKQSLSRVKERWIRNQDYHYACEQLKSIRQDLTVQGIRDQLTVEVYETHARIALEKGDHAEFNQCQSQLRGLYTDVPSSSSNRLEFTAYRILYYIFTKDFMDLSTVLATLTVEEKSDECVDWALRVRSAWWLGNYHRLFLLYRSAPRMSAYLMDWFLARERKQALKAIVKSYRQQLAVEFVSRELAFESESDCVEFMAQFGVIFADAERTKIDCKASTAPITAA